MILDENGTVGSISELLASLNITEPTEAELDLVSTMDSDLLRRSEKVGFIQQYKYEWFKNYKFESYTETLDGHKKNLKAIEAIEVSTPVEQAEQRIRSRFW